MSKDANLLIDAMNEISNQIGTLTCDSESNRDIRFGYDLCKGEVLKICNEVFVSKLY